MVEAIRRGAHCQGLWLAVQRGLAVVPAGSRTVWLGIGKGRSQANVPGAQIVFGGFVQARIDPAHEADARSQCQAFRKAYSRGRGKNQLREHGLNHERQGCDLSGLRRFPSR
ncbi:hypothetical protein D3C84_759390 [compost metagenome]